MGSVTHDHQVDLNIAMAARNEIFGVHHSHETEARKDIVEPFSVDGKSRSSVLH